MKNGLHIDEYGFQRWYLNGELHRENGPAIEWVDGRKYWCINGRYHREDGPAKECADGTKQWYLNGKWLGEGAAGFWRHWGLLAHSQRCNLNLHKWLAKYT